MKKSFRPGQTVYAAHPDEVEKLVVVERGSGDFNLKRRVADPYVLRWEDGSEFVYPASMLFADPLAAAIRSAELTAALDEEFAAEERRGRAANPTVPVVETYRMVTPSGRPIRQATRVRFPDGRVVSFMDKVPKGEAIKQAEELLRRGYSERPRITDVEVGDKFDRRGERLTVTRVDKKTGEVWFNDEQVFHIRDFDFNSLKRIPRSNPQPWARVFG